MRYLLMPLVSQSLSAVDCLAKADSDADLNKINLVGMHLDTFQYMRSGFELIYRMQTAIARKTRDRDSGS